MLPAVVPTGTSLATAEPSQVVALVEQATAYLAEANTIDEARNVRDFAALADTWTRQRDLGREAEKSAITLRLRAERRIGELLREGRQRGEIAGRGNVAHDDITRRTLPALGITRDESAAYQKLAEAAPDEFEEILLDAGDAGELSRGGVIRRIEYRDPIERREVEVERHDRAKPHHETEQFVGALDKASALADKASESIDVYLRDVPADLRRVLVDAWIGSIDHAAESTSRVRAAIAVYTTIRSVS